jgi:hypothetical protein
VSRFVASLVGVQNQRLKPQVLAADLKKEKEKERWRRMKQSEN